MRLMMGGGGGCALRGGVGRSKRWVVVVVRCALRGGVGRSKRWGGGGCVLRGGDAPYVWGGAP